MSHTHYTSEFKRACVLAVVEGNQKAVSVACEQGVAAATLYQWIRQSGYISRPTTSWVKTSVAQ